MIRRFRHRRCLLAATVGLAASVASAAAECRLQPGGAHVATKVVDAETIALDDGSEVRLIGALAPRAGDGDAAERAWPAEEAARAALAALVTGRKVQLKYGGERRDRHGRATAHVFVSGDDGRDTWVQAALLRDGHARAYAIEGNRACADELADAEATARREGKGLWAIPTYRVREAVFPRDLGAMTGSFRIVSGTVRYVSSRRDGLRLWLDGAGRRGELTVAIRSGDRDLLGSLGGDPKALQGRRLEVRGWIDQRRGTPGGPEIDASTAGMIRLLPGP